MARHTPLALMEYEGQQGTLARETDLTLRHFGFVRVNKVHFSQNMGGTRAPYPSS
jgi:hypothetical protein